MFAPSQHDVRSFFCNVYTKTKNLTPLEPIETLASLWIAEHPEYANTLANLDLALTTMDHLYKDQENPFLHLSMHLSISEQCSIDQPQGIRKAVERLANQKGDLHRAHHLVMACLGQIIHESQTEGKTPDIHKYLDLILRI